MTDDMVQPQKRVSQSDTVTVGITNIRMFQIPQQKQLWILWHTEQRQLQDHLTLVRSTIQTNMFVCMMMVKLLLLLLLLLKRHAAKTMLQRALKVIMTHILSAKYMFWAKRRFIFLNNYSRASIKNGLVDNKVCLSQICWQLIQQFTLQCSIQTEILQRILFRPQAAPKRIIPPKPLK